AQRARIEHRGNARRCEFLAFARRRGARAARVDSRDRFAVERSRPTSLCYQCHNRMRLAHCSDLHLLSHEGARWIDLANKRWIGAMNLLSNRSRHYHVEAFDDMVRD